MNERTIPTCFNLARARERFGSHADKLAPFLLRSDRLADAATDAFHRVPGGRGRKLFYEALDRGIDSVRGAPAALRELFAQVADVPLWVDWGRIDRGGETHRRCGVTGGLVLACGSLPRTYCTPAANKPLVFSGKLVNRAPLRLAETARFFLETCMPGGLRPYAPGWRTTVIVRIIHAEIRRKLRNSPRWDGAAWGLPLNQVDLAHTNLLFSVGLLDGLRRVGFHFSRAESESVMHLWRYSGYLLGIAPELLCATEDDGRRLMALIRTAQEPPDEDAQCLLKALMETAIPRLLSSGGPGGGKGAARVARFCYGLSHSLLGRQLAEGLGYPKTLWRHTARLLTRLVVTPAEVFRRLVPGAHARAVARGTRKARERLKGGPGGGQARPSVPP
jgi:hypothetical protein